MPRLRPAILAATTLSLGSALCAQTLFGAGTAGTGGIAPRAWFAGSPSPGTPHCAFEVDRAVGSAPAFLLVGLARTSQQVVGITVFVQPLASVFVGLATGATGAPGAGSASLPLSIPGSPSFLGLPLQAQWVVIDAGGPAGFAASEGLELRIVPPPLVLVAGTAGTLDRVYALDPATGAAPDWNATIGANNPACVEFTPDGTLCVVAAELSRRFLVADANNGGALLASVAVLGSAIPNAVAITPDGRRAYGISGGVQGWGRVIEIDLDRSSPTFGTQIGTATGLPAASQLEGVGISRNGRVLATCNLGLGETPLVAFVDIDRTSPTYNTVTQLPYMATDVRLSPDGSLAYLALAQLGAPGMLLVLDVATGLPVSLLTTLGDFPVDIEISPRGDFVLVACPNSQELVRVDVDPASPTYLARTSASVPLQPFAVTIAADGRTAWCNEMLGSAAHEIDTATMTVLRSFTIGAGGSAAICVR